MNFDDQTQPISPVNQNREELINKGQSQVPFQNGNEFQSKTALNIDQVDNTSDIKSTSDPDLVVANLPRQSKLPSTIALIFIGLISLGGGAYALFFNKTTTNKAPEVFELAPQGKLTCMPIDDNGNITNDKYRYNRMKVINKTGENRQVWVQWNQCSPDEVIHNPNGTIECQKYDKREPHIVGSGEENARIFNIDVSCESTGQLDIGADDGKSPCFNSIDNQDWQGGVAFTIKTNTQLCNQPTPTPTIAPTPTATPTAIPTPTTTPTVAPTPTLTPTPTPTVVPMTCLDLTTSKINPQRGDTVTYTCSGHGTNAVYANFRTLRNDQIISPYESYVELDENKRANWSFYIRPDMEAGVYKVQCQICSGNNSSSQCTTWSLAQ